MSGGPRFAVALALAIACVVAPFACYHGTNDVPLATGGASGQTQGHGGAASASSSTAATSTGGDGPGTTRTASTSTGGASGTGGKGAGGAGGGSNANGVFVAVGYGARTVRSTDDGLTWTDDTSLAPDGGSDDDYLLRTVTWGQSGFVAIGYRSMTSADGASWTDHGLTNLNQWIGGALYAFGQFVAVGGYGMRAVSPDGVTWTSHSIDTIATHPGDGIVYGDVMGGRLVSANDSGQRSYSSDGVTWTYSTSDTATLTTHLAFGNGIFLGIGGTDVVTSTDGGMTWTAGGSLGVAADGLVFADGQFTAVASGHVYTSSNGAAWVDHPVTGLQGGAIAYGHGTYVMVSGNALRRSTDGVTWATPVESGGINAFSWVAFGPVP